eukprot:GGOE01044999.1.p1 GENE.GGOE01044999.1~~GGOE01044999.1.p1  ORF type:complete len:724 (-),score=146.66 GGOE01044999.1:68-2086(-)
MSDTEDLSASRTLVLSTGSGSPHGTSPNKLPMGPAAAWAVDANGWRDPGDTPAYADGETKVEAFFHRETGHPEACGEEFECSTSEHRSHEVHSLCGVAEEGRGELVHSIHDAELSALFDEWTAAATRIQRCWNRHRSHRPLAAGAPWRTNAPKQTAVHWGPIPSLDIPFAASSTSRKPDRVAHLQTTALPAAATAAKAIQRVWRVHYARLLVSYKRYQQERVDILRDIEFRRNLHSMAPPSLLPVDNLELPSQLGDVQQKYVLTGSADTSRKSSNASAPAGSRQGSAYAEMGAEISPNPLARPISLVFSNPESDPPTNGSERRPSLLLHRDLQEPCPTPSPIPPPAHKLPLTDGPERPLVAREKNPLEVAAAQRPATGHVQLVLVGHTEAIRAIDLSWDRMRLATASQDCTVRVWDWQKQRQVVAIKAHRGFVFGCSFSPDGSTLASCSDDETIRLWDATTGAKQHTLRKHKGAVHSVQWARKEDVLASASGDGTVRVWHATKGKKLMTLRGHEDKVTFAAFSKDGEAVASVSGDGTIRWWDWRRGKEVMKYREHAGVPTSCLYGSGAQASLLAVGTTDGTVRIFDTRTWLPTAALRDHGAAVTHAAFVADTLRVVSSSVDGTVTVWDPRKGQALLTLHEHSGIVWQCAAWHDQVFSVGEDGRVVCTRLWVS